MNNKNMEKIGVGVKGIKNESIQISQKAQEVIDTYRKNAKDFPSDVLGSYTGMTDEMGRPSQDADDI